MTIRRYVASKDSTITNAYKSNLTTRATDANMGESDSLEVFSIYAQATTSSVELSRVLLDFPVQQIQQDRSVDLLPLSGNVQFVLKMSNAAHPASLPKKYSLVVNPLSRSWDEGYGLDMETYKDTGPVNWISASSTEAWTTEGGDIYSSPQFSQYFEDGTEDLEVDITGLVEEWLTGSLPSYGVMVSLSSSLETDNRSYYTKKFFSKGSEFFFKKPWIEARFDASVKDDRGKFYNYSPFVPAEESYNTIYLYNRYRGQLYDLPTVGTGNIYVGLYSTASLPLPTPLTMLNGKTLETGSWVSTGIYKANVAVDTTLKTIYDIWFDGSSNAIGTGGPIEVKDPDEASNFTKGNFVVSIKNLKPVYFTDETARLQIFIRSSQWNPNSYTSLNTTTQTQVCDDMYYKVYRIVDKHEAIPYGTGSYNHTRLSFDVNGNYLDIDMNLLEPGYSYGIKFTAFDMNEWHESKEVFKFRVEE